MQELSVFKTGGKNEAFAKYFIGQSYLNMLTTERVPIGNVTFEPGCRNNWHICDCISHKPVWNTIVCDNAAGCDTANKICFER